jgi:hypothetical protein
VIDGKTKAALSIFYKKYVSNLLELHFWIALLLVILDRFVYFELSFLAGLTAVCRRSACL